MARFFHLLYYYLLGFLVFFVAYMVVMLVVSPRQDLQKRGFIPCTEEFVLSVADCTRGEMICPLKYLWHDTTCNATVILDGFGAWVRGKQPTPWANYLFVPELSEQSAREDYNGDIAADMQDLEAQSQFIERKNRELDEAQKRGLDLRDDVLLSSSEDILYNETTAEDVAPIIEEENKGDISDEAFMEEIEVNKEPQKNE